ncbi:helix-turn-helix transcriptional regulator [Pseudomonas sp. NPDC090755]|uniref:helix-turn-helix transcriptional regulator n=1 Tax=Pseudomonas sp. NPDC090755 TaxID=3364481 RepID=UPI00383A33B7
MVTQVRKKRLYDELVDLCYECALDTTSWQRLLERLVETSGHQKVFLFHVRHHQSDAQAVMAINLAAPAGVNGPHWQPTPGLEFSGSHTLGYWHKALIDFGSEQAVQDQHSHTPYGLHHVASVRLDEQADSGIYLTVLHQVGAPSPSARHYALLERITPHLLKAVKVSARINGLEQDLAKRDLLLDHHTTPLWLLDDEGQVLHGNQAARHMSLSGSPLFERFARLHSTTQDSHLRKLIRRAAGKNGKRQAGWLRLDTSEAQALLVTPVPAEADCNPHFNKPLVLLALLENRLPSPLLAELFQLSPAEHRLAELLAQGLTLECCATRLNVSINTVKTQLRALFRKTGTTRQAQLITLFARLIGG